MAKINPKGVLEWMHVVGAALVVGVGAYVLYPLIKAAGKVTSGVSDGVKAVVDAPKEVANYIDKAGNDFIDSYFNKYTVDLAGPVSHNQGLGGAGGSW